MKKQEETWSEEEEVTMRKEDTVMKTPAAKMKE